jgi:hypothetical protein
MFSIRWGDDLGVIACIYPRLGNKEGSVKTTEPCSVFALSGEVFGPVGHWLD